MGRSAMGCGSSRMNRRVAAQKDHTAKSVDATGDVVPATPTTVADEQPALVPTSAQTQQELVNFAQKASPPSLPVGDSCHGPPSAPESGEAGAIKPSPVALPAAENARGSDSAIVAGSGNGGNSSDAVVPYIVPSNDDKPSGESAELPGNGGREEEVGDYLPAKRRSAGVVSKVAESQRPPGLHGQDPLPRIVPSSRSSAESMNILSRGYSGLGPGLDACFREDPTNIATAVDDDVSTRDRNCDEEDLVLDCISSDDLSDEQGLRKPRAGDGRWPRDDRNISHLETKTRGGFAEDGGSPPWQESRSTLATIEASGELRKAADSSKSGFAEGGVLSIGKISTDAGGGAHGLRAATGDGAGSLEGDVSWGASSGAYSLLDADEEDFMEALLVEG